MKRDQLNDTYLDLIEKQRLYFKTVKDFKEVSSFIYKLINDTYLNLKEKQRLYFKTVKGFKEVCS